MPDWCDNRLVVTGAEEGVSSFMAAVTDDGSHNPVWEGITGGSIPCQLAFWMLVPYPQPVLDKGYNDAGYDWEADNWSCKWGASDIDVRILKGDPGRVEYLFRTPWCYPRKWLDKVAKLYPSLWFRISWKAESGSRGRHEWNKDTWEKVSRELYGDTRKPRKSRKSVKARKSTVSDRMLEMIVDRLEVTSP
jgi:hypothetical protein